MDSAVIGLISLVVTSMTALGLAYIAFRTAKLGKVVDDVKRQTDGLTSALVASTAKASHAEGKIEGKEELKSEQAEGKA